MRVENQIPCPHSLAHGIIDGFIVVTRSQDIPACLASGPYNNSTTIVVAISVSTDISDLEARIPEDVFLLKLWAFKKGQQRCEIAQ